MSHRRFPSYPDDADYNTNAPSYYEDLARKQALIKELAERIWGYEEQLNLSKEEIAARFIEWDAKIAGFDGDLNELLQEWMADGTFDEIINQTIFNDLNVKIGETVKGEAGKTVQTLAGVIRNTGTGWFFIDDTTHNRVNMNTITVQNGSLRVEHTPLATKVGSLIASPDETFAKEGLIVGASVGSTFSLIDLFFPLNVAVKGDSTFVSRSYFSPSLLLTFSADKSSFTLTHPDCDPLDIPVVAHAISAGSSGELATSYGATSVTVERRGDLAGYIYYDVATSTWKYVGENVDNLTFSYASGVLTVTHDAIIGNAYALVVSERDGGYKPKVVSPSVGSFQLKFFDSANTLITVPDANCKTYFARVGGKYKMPIKSTDRVLIRRGHCKADAQHVVNTAGNVWIYGAMQL